MTEEEIKIKKRAIIKAKYKIKPLLYNIKEEESTVQDNIKEIMSKININFSKDFILVSSSQVYKTISSIGLTKILTGSKSYKLLDFGIILDVWFNEATDYFNKTDCFKPDVLIIKGSLSSLKQSYDYKLQAIQDILSIRRDNNKVTWIFIKSDKDNTGVTDMVKNDLSESITITELKY